MTKNSIALYKGLVNLTDANQNNLAMAMSVNHQLMIYGYMLDEKAFNMLKKADAADIADFYQEVINYLKVMTGGKHSFKSFYGNFPNDIMSRSQSELFYDQISHYWGKQCFPDTSKSKEEAFEHVNYRMITACTEEEFIKEVYVTLAQSGQSLNPADQKILSWFGKSGLTLPVVDVPFKENLAILASLIPTFTVKTTVDVLRIAVAFSGGDPSLPAVPKKPTKGRNLQDRIDERNKFRFKLNTQQSTRILELFENSNLDVRDMKQGSRYQRFIRLAEIIHPEVYTKKYPKTAAAFYHLRNQKRKGKKDGMPVIRTWYSDVKKAFTIDFLTGVTKLSERSGEFLRKLDYLVRTYPQHLDKILLTLTRIGEKSSNKVLFEVFTHFEERISPVTGRSVFIKGAKKKTELPNLPALPISTIEAIQDTIINIIKEKFSSLPEMGKCYIDEELKKIPLPTNMRSMSESLVPVIRGQRIPLQEGKKYLRSFVHWQDKKGDQDIDLHGFLIGKGKSVSFGFNGHYKSDIGCYSGDIRHRKGNNAEYVDINIDAAKKEFDYYLMVIHNFQQEPFYKLNDCYAGFMEREDSKVNKTWIPSSVTNCIHMTSSSSYCLVAAVDLNTREYIPLDLDWGSFSKYVSGSSSAGLFNAIQPFIAPPKLSVYDLITWHVHARKGISTTPENADIHFLFSDYSKDYTQTLKLLGV